MRDESLFACEVHSPEQVSSCPDHTLYTLLESVTGIQTSWTFLAVGASPAILTDTASTAAGAMATALVTGDTIVIRRGTALVRRMLTVTG